MAPVSWLKEFHRVFYTLMSHNMHLRTYPANFNGENKRNKGKKGVLAHGQ